MLIENTKKGKLIILSQAFDDRAKLLYCFYFINFFLGGNFLLWKYLQDTHTTGLTVMAILFIPALYIAAFRFINSAILSERMQITTSQLKMIRKCLWGSSETAFDLDKISNFRYIEKATLSEHPLAGKSMDYLGFQTQDIVTNEMIGENKLAFDYQGATVSFGKDVYSWEYEKIESLLAHSLSSL